MRRSDTSALCPEEETENNSRRTSPRFLSDYLLPIDGAASSGYFTIMNLCLLSFSNLSICFLSAMGVQLISVNKRLTSGFCRARTWRGMVRPLTSMAFRTFTAQEPLFSTTLIKRSGQKQLTSVRLGLLKELIVVRVGWGAFEGSGSVQLSLTRVVLHRF